MASVNSQDSVANAINVPLPEPTPEVERRLLNEDVAMEGGEPNSALPQTENKNRGRKQKL